VAKQGLRIVCIAMKPLAELPANPTAEDVENDLIFVGLVALSDPAREGVIDDIKACQNAGITTIMVTGDNLETAKAVATEIGILREGTFAITGAELSEMTDEELTENIEKYSCDEAYTTYMLYEYWEKNLDNNEQKLVKEVELPLTKVLAKMEYTGVAIDVDYLKKWNVIITNNTQSKNEKWDLCEHFSVGKTVRSKYIENEKEDYINIKILRGIDDVLSDIPNENKSIDLSSSKSKLESRKKIKIPQLIIYRIDGKGISNKKSKYRVDLNLDYDIVGLYLFIPGNRYNGNVRKVSIKIPSISNKEDGEE
jgi:hydroxymethylpyrimidine pyrophosphatase-like HAD family hydrolase